MQCTLKYKENVSSAHVLYNQTHPHQALEHVVSMLLRCSQGAWHVPQSMHQHYAACLLTGMSPFYV